MKEEQLFMSSLPEGVSPHNALTRWLTTAAKIDAAVIRVKNLGEFVETYSGAGEALRMKDIEVIELMTAQANKTTCRLCGKCQSHCPQHIPVTDILRYERYAMDDHDWEKASSLYAGLPVRADVCKNCGSCIEACPIHLQVPEKLAKAHFLLT